MTSQREPDPQQSTTPEVDPTLAYPHHDATRSNPGPEPEDVTIAHGALDRVLGDVGLAPFGERFPLGRSLGKGGMAEVFRAQDKLLHREVAVKRMRDGSDRPARLRRFIREAQITAQLSHPNVVPVHALESVGDGEPALVMKCVQGLTLKEFLWECRGAWGTDEWSHTRHGLDTRLEILIKICDAVAFAHSRGVVHLDLKPANVMLGAFGEVYLMDWGIARVLTQEEQEHVPATAETETWEGGDAGKESEQGGAKDGESVVETSGLETGAGGVLGTPLYMPPEQMRGRAVGVGPAADQFALGMILHEMLTLRSPRPTSPLDATLQYAQFGKRLPIGSGEGEPPAPPALQAVVARATAREPGDRYASVQGLALELRHYRRGDELLAWPDNFTRRLWRRIQKRPVHAMTVVLSMVVLAATVAVFSLTLSLSQSRQHEWELQVQSELVSKVSAFVHTQDQRAKDVARLVESLAVETESALKQSGVEGVNRVLMGPQGVAAAYDAEFEPRYRQQVTFTEPVVVFAPDHDGALAAEQLRHLNGFGEVFRDQFRRGIQGVPDSLTEFELTALLRERAWMAYAYVGLTSGALLNFPGNETWPEDYDPRQRPWYREAPAGRMVAWGEPYPDASGSGFLVPCNRRIFGADRTFHGVVGIDVQLDRLIEALKVPGLQSVRATQLVDQRGLVVAEEDDVGSTWGVGTFGNRSKDREPLPSEGLRRKLQQAPENGLHQEGDNLFVFCRIAALDWYVVVELDRSDAFRRLDRD